MKLFHKKRKEKIVYSEKNEHNIQDPVLLQEIEKVKLDMETAYSNFQNVVDPDLIDCYIYELNSVQMRYKFLLTSIKKYEQANFGTENSALI